MIRVHCVRMILREYSYARCFFNIGADEVEPLLELDAESMDECRFVPLASAFSRCDSSTLIAVSSTLSYY
jgi:hypothetical protein